MAESKGSNWVVIVAAALVAALAYGLFASDDAEVDSVPNAAMEDPSDGVDHAPAIATGASEPRIIQSTPRQMKMNSEVDAARQEVMDSMKKMADDAAKTMESQKKGVENSMGSMNGMADE